MPNLTTNSKLPARLLEQENWYWLVASSAVPTEVERPYSLVGIRVACQHSRRSDICQDKPKEPKPEHKSRKWPLIRTSQATASALN